MQPLNQAGPAEAELGLPPLVDPAALQHRIEHGDWVVDLRSRKAYAADHLRGTVSIELPDPFATYLGWTVPWDAPLTLIGDSADDVVAARRHLARIGIAHMAAALAPPLAPASGGHPPSPLATSAPPAPPRPQRR